MSRLPSGIDRSITSRPTGMVWALLASIFLLSLGLLGPNARAQEECECIPPSWVVDPGEQCICTIDACEIEGWIPVDVPGEGTVCMPACDQLKSCMQFVDTMLEESTNPANIYLTVCGSGV